MSHKELRSNIKYLANNKGIAMVTVIMVFVFISILTTSVVAMVYSDNQFSQADENGKKAYYAARSAVTVVEQSIKDQIEILDQLQVDLDNKETGYNNASPEQRDAARSAWESATIAYQSKYDFIMGTAANINVLPNASHPTIQHDIEYDSVSFETPTPSNKFTVTLTYISDKKYRLECETSVKGQPSKVARLLDINDNEGTSSIQLSQLIGAFDNAIWVDETISVEKNNVVWSGDVSYGSGAQPNIEMKDGEINKRDQPVTLDTPLQAFNDLSNDIALNDKTGVFYTTSGGKHPVNNITPANNGRYTSPVAWDSDYVVNTSGGNVVLRFDNVSSLGQNASFTASGDGVLIIYVSNISNSEVNNLTFDASGATDIYLIFDGEASGFSKNNIYGNNLYIYAPETDLEFQNNLGGPGAGKGKFVGSILSNTLILKNNADIFYVPPKYNPVIGETNEGGTILSQQIHSLSFTQNSHWLKD